MSLLKGDKKNVVWGAEPTGAVTDIGEVESPSVISQRADFQTCVA